MPSWDDDVDDKNQKNQELSTVSDEREKFAKEAANDGVKLPSGDKQNLLFFISSTYESALTPVI